MPNDDNDTSMMNVNENVLDYLKDYLGTSDILESWNPPIISRHVSSLTTSNFDTYRHSLKKFQRWLHSLLTMRGRCMTFLVGELEVQWHLKRVPTNILQMETMNDDNETSIINVDANMEDIKDYVGTSYILESWNPPILSRHVSSLTMSNFNTYRKHFKKVQSWPHSLLIVQHWWLVCWKRFHEISREFRKIPNSPNP